ncbi:MAG: hypothetical protein IT497_10965 [Ottowia sp.]|nr:hypothetical protein [Ottowia sp.]
MPKITRTPKKVVSLYPDPAFKTMLESQAKTRCVSMNEYCLNLITRGLLAEDVETIRADLGAIVEKISDSGGLRKKEQFVILELLAYMRIYFSKENSANVQKAKEFAETAIKELCEESA